MRKRLTAALGAVLFMMTAGFAPVAATPAQAKAPGRNQVSIILENVTPSVLGAKTKTLKIKGKIVNSGSTALTGVQVSAQYGARLTTRAQLGEFAAGGAGTATAAFDTSRGPFDLPANGSQRFTLTGDATRLTGIAPGDLSVYPLAITASDAEGPLDAEARTFVNYVPKDAKKTIKPTRVAFVWPLIDTPRRTTDAEFTDDGLASSLDPDDGTDGRLNALLDAADSGSTANAGAVTLAIDPALVTDVEAMQRDYQVVKRTDNGDGGTDAAVENKPSNGDAKNWLSRLRAYVDEDRQFFLTPYADVDSVSLVNKKMAQGSVNLLKAAYSDKKRATDILNAEETYKNLAWPGNGTINQATIDRLVRLGDKGSSQFLLTSDQLQAVAGLSHTPSAAHTVETSGGKVKPALAFDETIQQVISGNTRAEGGALSARQRYLAETAMMTAEAPSQPRTLIVVPDRRWNPDPGFAKFLLNHKDARSGWLKPTPLGVVAQQRTEERQLVTYPDRDAEFSRTYLDDVKAMYNKSTAFANLFAEADTSLLRAPMRASSNAWRGGGARKEAAYGFLDATEKAVDAEVGKINLASEEVKQLAGSSGMLRFTVVNELTEGQVTVRIEISAEHKGELVFPDSSDPQVFTDTRPVDAGQKDTFMVAVKLPTGGSINNKIPVKVRILNEAGQEINSSTLDVSTTGVSAVGLFITIGALGVLVVGVGFRGMRARRRRKEEEARDDGAAAG
ncbi:DUF6049 family protein [Actinocorallia aurea]